MKFITLSSPKADRRLIRPEAVEDSARDGIDDDEDGVELMETESGDLNLVLEDTQTQQVQQFNFNVKRLVLRSHLTLMRIRILEKKWISLL